MKTLHLATLRDQGTSALTTASMELVDQQARLDCSGVERLTSEELTKLFEAIPDDWDIAGLHTVIDTDTLSEPLAQQLAAWIDVRLGFTENESQQPDSLTQRRGGTQAQSEGKQSESLHLSDSASLRYALEQALINDLRGPCDGAEEIVDERNVRGRYVVGLLAPKGQSAIPEIVDDSDPLDRASEDGSSEAPPSKAASTMLPSSIGLTFAVAPEATALKLTARWGRYERVSIEDDTYRNKDGSLRRVWQRQPIEGISDPIPLKAGRIDPWSPCPDYPDVTVQGIVRQREHQWIVTLFLVNGQQEPPKNKDSAWVFQPELCVESPDGAPIFQRRAPISEDTDLDTQMMAMRYRNQVEFAKRDNPPWCPRAFWWPAPMGTWTTFPELHLSIGGQPTAKPACA